MLCELQEPLLRPTPPCDCANPSAEAAWYTSALSHCHMMHSVIWTLHPNRCDGRDTHDPFVCLITALSNYEHTIQALRILCRSTKHTYNRQNAKERCKRRWKCLQETFVPCRVYLCQTRFRFLKSIPVLMHWHCNARVSAAE